MGASDASTTRTPSPSESGILLPAPLALDDLPRAKPAWRDSTTVPTAPAGTTSPMATEPAYESARAIMPRM